MVREVILVEVVTKSDMSTDKSKTFTNTEKAEKYFTDCVHEIMPNIEQDEKYFADCVHELMPNIEQDEIDNALDDGFWDCKYSGVVNDEKSVIIKEISFEED